VLVLLLVLVLENSRYLTVTLIDGSSAGRFGPCFDAGFQHIEHDDEHEHNPLTSESGYRECKRAANPSRALLSVRDPDIFDLHCVPQIFPTLRLMIIKPVATLAVIHPRGF
jgi:hypothetical protein